MLSSIFPEPKIGSGIIKCCRHTQMYPAPADILRIIQHQQTCSELTNTFRLAQNYSAPAHMLRILLSICRHTKNTFLGVNPNLHFDRVWYIWTSMCDIFKPTVTILPLFCESVSLDLHRAQFSLFTIILESGTMHN